MPDDTPKPPDGPSVTLVFSGGGQVIERIVASA
jgi:hypothetical protein